MNVKAIEHVSGLLYGNNLGNLVNHVVHGRGGAQCFRSSPFLSKLFPTQSRMFNRLRRSVEPLLRIFGDSSHAMQLLLTERLTLSIRYFLHKTLHFACLFVFNTTK